MIGPRAGAHARTIFVAGARRNAGKTLVSELLLRAFPGTGAVKLTCCRPEQGCPRKRPCGVCGALTSPFAVIQEYRALAQPGKDTARLLAAADGRVVWLQSREEALPEAMAAALAVFDSEPAAIVEGNAAFLAMRPDLGVLVLGPGGEAPKASARVTYFAIDAVVRNVRRGLAPPAAAEEVAEGLPTFTFDASSPRGDPGAERFLAWVANRVDLRRA